jgi:hypothetical protein
MSSFSCLYCDFETAQSGRFLTHCQKSKNHMNNCKNNSTCYKCFLVISKLSLEDHVKKCKQLDEKFYEKLEKTVVILINRFGVCLQIIENFNDGKLTELKFNFITEKSDVYILDFFNFDIEDVETMRRIGVCFRAAKAALLSKLDSLVSRNIINSQSVSVFNDFLGFGELKANLLKEIKSNIYYRNKYMKRLLKEHKFISN